MATKWRHYRNRPSENRAHEAVLRAFPELHEEFADVLAPAHFQLLEALRASADADGLVESEAGAARIPLKQAADRAVRAEVEYARVRNAILDAVEDAFDKEDGAAPWDGPWSRETARDVLVGMVDAIAGDLDAPTAKLSPELDAFGAAIAGELLQFGYTREGLLRMIAVLGPKYDLDVDNLIGYVTDEDEEHGAFVRSTIVH
jgi:hypothetical protein